MNIIYELTGVASKTLTQEVGISMLLLESTKPFTVETIEVVLKKNSGKDTILIDEIKIDDYLEQMTESEDIYVKTTNRGLGVIALTKDKTISLALDPKDNEYIEINLGKLIVANKYSVNGIETFMKERSAISYDVKTMRDKKTTVDVEGYQALIMPIDVATPFELTLTNGNGHSIDLDQREYLSMATLNGEVKGLETIEGAVAGAVATVDLSPIFSNKDFVIVMVGGVKEVQIKGKAGLEYTLVSMINY